MERAKWRPVYDISLLWLNPMIGSTKYLFLTVKIYQKKGRFYWCVDFKIQGLKFLKLLLLCQMNERCAIFKGITPPKSQIFVLNRRQEFSSSNFLRGIDIKTSKIAGVFFCGKVFYSENPNCCWLKKKGRNVRHPENFPSE